MKLYWTQELVERKKDYTFMKLTLWAQKLVRGTPFPTQGPISKGYFCTPFQPLSRVFLSFHSVFSGAKWKKKFKKGKKGRIVATNAKTLPHCHNMHLNPYRVGSLFTTVREAQKQQLKQPQTPILFWPSNILAMAVISWEGLSFEE